MLGTVLRLEFKAMGSPCAIDLHEAPGVDAEAVARECIDEIERLEAKYSRYRPDSITSRINRSAGQGFELDDETASLLDYAEVAYVQSGGLFDITSGVLRGAWDFRSGRVPTDSEIDAARARVGWRTVERSRGRLLLREGMELDFGGLVKEYAADRVAEHCRQRGAAHGMIDLGGDLAVIGPHPDGSPWRIGVRDPRRPEAAVARLSLSSGAVASSGDYERCMVVDGVRYGHILNPRTGWPVSGMLSVTVVASHCILAGTASTIAMLKGSRGPEWLDELGLSNLRMDHEGLLSGTLAPRSPLHDAQATPPPA